MLPNAHACISQHDAAEAAPPVTQENSGAAVHLANASHDAFRAELAPTNTVHSAVLYLAQSRTTLICTGNLEPKGMLVRDDNA